MRVMAHPLTSVVFCFLALLALSGPAPGEVNALAVGLVRNRAEEFVFGAEVHVAEIMAVEELPRSQRSINRFKVKLRIVRTLLGGSRTTASVVGWKYRPGILGYKRTPCPWEAIRLQSKTKLLCVLSLNGIDPIVGKVPNTQAAFEVHEIKTASDPIVREFETITAIEKMGPKAGKELSASLRRALADRRYPVQRYALRTAARWLGAEEATPMLSTFLKERPKATKKENRVILGALADLCSRRDLNKKEKAQSWLALAGLILSDAEEVRRLAVIYFRSVIQGPGMKEFEVLKPRLQRVLKPLAKDGKADEGLREAARTILQWLDKPPAPATRPAASPATVPALTQPGAKARFAWRLDAYKTLRYQVKAQTDGWEGLEFVMVLQPKGERCGSFVPCVVSVSKGGFRYTPARKGPAWLRGINPSTTTEVLFGHTGPVGWEDVGALSLFLSEFVLPPFSPQAKVGDKTDRRDVTTSESTRVRDISLQASVKERSKDSMTVRKDVRRRHVDPSDGTIRYTRAMITVGFTLAGGIVRRVSQKQTVDTTHPAAKQAPATAPANGKPPRKSRRAIEIDITLVEANAR